MFTRILLAIDRTDSGEVATSFTSAMARRLGSSVRVVHVNEVLVGGRGFAAETEREAMHVVDEAVRCLRNQGSRRMGCTTSPTASPCRTGSPRRPGTGAPT